MMKSLLYLLVMLSFVTTNYSQAKECGDPESLRISKTAEDTMEPIAKHLNASSCEEITLGGDSIILSDGPKIEEVAKEMMVKLIINKCKQDPNEFFSILTSPKGAVELSFLLVPEDFKLIGKYAHGEFEKLSFKGVTVPVTFTASTGGSWSKESHLLVDDTNFSNITLFQEKFQYGQNQVGVNPVGLADGLQFRDISNMQLQIITTKKWSQYNPEHAVGTGFIAEYQNTGGIYHGLAGWRSVDVYKKDNTETRIYGDFIGGGVYIADSKTSHTSDEMGGAGGGLGLRLGVEKKVCTDPNGGFRLCARGKAEGFFLVAPVTGAVALTGEVGLRAEQELGNHNRSYLYIDTSLRGTAAAAVLTSGDSGQDTVTGVGIGATPTINIGLAL